MKDNKFRVKSGLLKRTETITVLGLPRKVNPVVMRTAVFSKDIPKIIITSLSVTKNLSKMDPLSALCYNTMQDLVARNTNQFFCARMASVETAANRTHDLLKTAKPGSGLFFACRTEAIFNIVFHTLKINGISRTAIHGYSKV